MADEENTDSNDMIALNCRVGEGREVWGERLVSTVNWRCTNENESLFYNIIVTHPLAEMLCTFLVSQSLLIPLFLASVELALTLWRKAVLTPGSSARKCWGSAPACELCHPRCKLGD